MDHQLVNIIFKSFELAELQLSTPVEQQALLYTSQHPIFALLNDDIDNCTFRLQQIRVFHNRWNERKGHHCVIGFRFDHQVKLADQKQIDDGVMIEEQEVLLQKVAVFISKMAQSVNDQLVLIADQKLNLLLISAPKTFASSSYLDALRKLDLWLNAGDAQCLRTTNSYQNFLIVQADDIARVYLFQAMLHLINLHLRQDQSYLDTYQTQSLQLVNEIQPWPWGFIETQTKNLFYLKIANILQKDDIIAFPNLIDCQLGLHSHCQIAFTWRHRECRYWG